MSDVMSRPVNHEQDFFSVRAELRKHTFSETDAHAALERIYFNLHQAEHELLILTTEREALTRSFRKFRLMFYVLCAVTFVLAVCYAALATMRCP